MTGFSLDISVSAVGVAEGVDQDIQQWVDEFGLNIGIAVEELMGGRRSGRLSRRGSFNRRHSKGLGQRAAGRGSRFHIPSAEDEPLATDTGDTVKSFSIRRLSKGTVRIRVSGGIGFWEFRASGARPTLIPAIELAARRTFNER
jgi:hypothetical protein